MFVRSELAGLFVLDLPTKDDPDGPSGSNPSRHVPAELLPLHRFTEFSMIRTDAITSSHEYNRNPDGYDTDDLDYAHQHFVASYAVDEEKHAGDKPD